MTNRLGFVMILFLSFASFPWVIIKGFDMKFPLSSETELSASFVTKPLRSEEASLKPDSPQEASLKP
jgi:hypothetical protein